MDVRYLPEEHLILARVAGDLTNEVNMHVMERAAQLGTEHGCDRLLFDYRENRLVESTAGIYMYPETSGLVGTGTPRFQIAVLYNRDEGKYQFWETVMLNRGALARVFTNEREARDWLRQSRDVFPEPTDLS